MDLYSKHKTLLITPYPNNPKSTPRGAFAFFLLWLFTVSIATLIAIPTNAGINKAPTNKFSIGTYIDNRGNLTVDAEGNINIIGTKSIRVKAKKLHNQGVLIANATLNPDGTLKDKGNLDWQVGNYSERHLNNSDKSNASGFNASFSANGKDPRGNPTYGSTTLGAHRQGHDRQGNTLATIGKTKQGKQVGANQHLNRSQIITKDHQTGGLDVSTTLNHRLLNKAGRELIKKDFDILAKGTGLKADLIKQGDLKNKNVFINGMLTNKENTKILGKNMTGEKDPQIWHNPTHGFLYDLIESALDYTGIGSANSRKADKWMSKNKNLKIHGHSQGTLIMERGAKNNTDKGHEYFTYGNPWRPFQNSDSQMMNRFGENLGGDVKLPRRNDGDFVSKPLNMFDKKNWSKPGHMDYYKKREE